MLNNTLLIFSLQFLPLNKYSKLSLSFGHSFLSISLCYIWCEILFFLFCTQTLSLSLTHLHSHRTLVSLTRLSKHLLFSQWLNWSSISWVKLKQSGLNMMKLLFFFQNCFAIFGYPVQQQSSQTPPKAVSQ